MKKYLSILLAGFAASLFIIAYPGHARADVNNFTVTNFNGDYTLTNQDPQGQLNIKETIDVSFTDNNHGILRAIPSYYQNHGVHIDNIKVTKQSGEAWQYTTYNQNDNLVLKIGDPNNTVTGQQEFIITYSVHNVVTFYNDHDELYWDINGDQWQQPFEKVTATFHIDNSYLSDPLKLACYTGSINNGQSKCLISSSAPGTIDSTATIPLAPYQTLTDVISLKKGIFVPTTFASTIRENLKIILAVFGPPILVLVFCFWRWFFKGRDPKGRGTIIPEYDAPDGLRPAMVGAIIDFTVDNRDISATIIDLAVRKYLRIIEADQKKLVGTKKTYSLQLINPDLSQLNDYEQSIMNGLFTKKQASETIDLSSLKTSFYKVAGDVRTKINTYLKNEGYFANDPSKILAKASAAFFLAFGAFYIIRNGFVVLDILVCAIIFYFFEKVMAKRTAKGVAAKEYIQGLKLFLQTADAERFKKLQSPDSPYAEHNDAPVKTVNLFEKLLPYAIALGVEKDWAGQFKDIYTQPPDWYSGNWQTFNTIYFVSALSGSVSAMSSNFSPPSSSGSSGFGGGGFAGGGGGGGGGGGW